MRSIGIGIITTLALLARFPTRNKQASERVSPDSESSRLSTVDNTESNSKNNSK